MNDWKEEITNGGVNGVNGGGWLDKREVFKLKKLDSSCTCASSKRLATVSWHSAASSKRPSCNNASALLCFSCAFRGKK